jgi:hypothetical protein
MVAESQALVWLASSYSGEVTMHARSEEGSKAHERRRRIRDFTHEGTRWIVSMLGSESADCVWRGHLGFFLETDKASPRVEDPLRFEALEFDELTAQAEALSLQEVQTRLIRMLETSRS